MMMFHFILTIIMMMMMMMVTISKSAPYSGVKSGNIIRGGQSQIMAAPIMIRTTNSNSGYGSLYGRLASSSNGGGGGGGGIIPIAIQTKHNIEYKDVPSSGSIQTATVEVGARSIPINIIFRSASSSLNVLQRHQGAGGDTQESHSEDEPHVLRHTVKKPIYQIVNEIITPYRKISQEVHPVQEEIKTVVAKNSNHHQPVGQNRPTTINNHYAAAASTNRNHHHVQPSSSSSSSSSIILGSHSMEDDDDIDNNNNNDNNDYQKLLQSGSAIVTTSSVLKGTDVDGKSIAKSMDQNLTKSLDVIRFKR
ncbi:dfp2-like protein 12 [Dermatophagoides farinae]|uniref:Dfp2-like protein 12 n=1 Tax=Dermatophagoides farinae TaxID=6954 RepID=A0A9D4P3S8_DERFA|nr:dfp2-like protein 12 [Dermatophagoides farinae]